MLWWTWWQIPFKLCFNLIWCIPSISRIARSHGSSVFNFLKNTLLFSQQLYHSLIHQCTMIPFSSTSLPMFISLFDSSHLSRCEVVSHWICHFLMMVMYIISFFQIYKSPHFQRCWSHTPISILRTKPYSLCGSGSITMQVRELEIPPFSLVGYTLNLNMISLWRVGPVISTNPLFYVSKAEKKKKERENPATSML